MNGALLVDKPSGPTSFDVVARVRRALGRGVKVGHAGTLDPFASGLLLIVAGRATRLVPYLVGLDKRYLATVRLGVRSDTGDREGVLEETGRPLPDADTLEAACAAFVGEIEQVPPAASAVHVAGRRSYELARAGHAVELPPRTVSVRRMQLVAYHPAVAIAEIDVACSKGTYVRALARDLGEALGCGAHCRELRRTGVGAFVVAAAGTPEQVAGDPTGPWSLTPAAVVSHLPARALSEPELAEVAHGRPLELRGEQGPVRCLHADRLVCVAEPVAGRLRPRVVLEPAA